MRREISNLTLLQLDTAASKLAMSRFDRRFIGADAGKSSAIFAKRRWNTKGSTDWRFATSVSSHFLCRFYLFLDPLIFQAIEDLGTG